MILPRGMQSPNALYALLTIAVLTGTDEASRRCRVKDINVYEVDKITSIITYNISLQDPTCSGKRQWTSYISSCANRKQIVQSCLVMVDGGRCEVKYNGTWYLNLRGHTTSNCFSVLGRVVDVHFESVFKTHGLNLTFRNPPDLRVNTWDLTIYQAEKYKYPSCEELRKPLYEGLQQFRQIGHVRGVGNRSILQLKQQFDPKGCYCFRLQPFGPVPLSSVEPFSARTANCTPVPDIRPDATEESNIVLKSWHVMTLVGLAVVVMVVVMTVVLCMIYKRRSSYRNTTINRNSFNETSALLTPETCELLLLYAGDPEHHRQAAGLRSSLQCHFKVHDLYRHGDGERSADCNDWLLRKLLRSVMKIVMIDSPALATICRDFCTLHNEKGKVEQLADQHILLQLRFVLRHIIATPLMQDYSRVFVVRFDDASVKEEDVGLVVKSRRYNLPCHHDVLLQDLLGLRKSEEMLSLLQ